MFLRGFLLEKALLSTMEGNLLNEDNVMALTKGQQGDPRMQCQERGGLSQNDESKVTPLLLPRRWREFSISQM